MLILIEDIYGGWNELDDPNNGDHGRSTNLLKRSDAIQAVKIARANLQGRAEVGRDGPALWAGQELGRQSKSFPELVLFVPCSCWHLNVAQHMHNKGC